MGTTLILLYSFPVLLLIVFLAYGYHIGKFQTSAVIGGIVTVIAVLLVGMVQATSAATAFADTEVINGFVTTKNRNHGTYDESYSCNCVTKYRTESYSSGSGKNRTTKTRRVSYQSCSTCYRKWFTVKWNCDSTIGQFNFGSVQSLLPTVYATPNPALFEATKVNDPVAKLVPYENYIQSSTHSLYNTRIKNSTMFGVLPEYPIVVHDMFKIDRFVNTGANLNAVETLAWNDGLARVNAVVGPKKQGNVVFVLSQNRPMDYADALEAKWDGVNKNDIVVIVNLDLTGNITWTKILSWTKAEDFKIAVRDRINAVKVLDREKILGIIQEEAVGKFQRRKMAEFAYLKDELEISSVALGLLIAAIISGFIGGSVILRRQ